MSEAIQILQCELDRRRVACDQLAADMDAYRQKIADMDARASVLSREIGEIERAIRALGGIPHGARSVVRAKVETTYVTQPTPSEQAVIRWGDGTAVLTLRD